MNLPRSLANQGYCPWSLARGVQRKIRTMRNGLCSIALGDGTPQLDSGIGKGALFYVSGTGVNISQNSVSLEYGIVFGS